MTLYDAIGITNRAFVDTVQYPTSLICHKEFEGDHAQKTNTRTGLSQKLFTTHSKEDNCQCVLVRKDFHGSKELKNHKEPSGTNYNTGLYRIFDYC